MVYPQIVTISSITTTTDFISVTNNVALHYLTLNIQSKKSA
ncbi:hypothetical protein GAB14E_0294 [Colwellia psychrerythraea]|uniref:Uncharacterized protein n=1 Tax=Colwellia psychrerythraea TaxID=28229 RepID=A0A099L2F6_COLPS|nr:hypothetical protein GAB14E_0294 [Colwellia psychrerythraea]